MKAELRRSEQGAKRYWFCEVDIPCFLHYTLAGNNRSSTFWSGYGFVPEQTLVLCGAQLPTSQVYPEFPVAMVVPKGPAALS